MANATHGSNDGRRQIVRRRRKKEASQRRRDAPDAIVKRSRGRVGEAASSRGSDVGLYRSDDPRRSAPSRHPVSGAMVWNGQRSSRRARDVRGTGTRAGRPLRTNDTARAGSLGVEIAEERESRTPRRRASHRPPTPESLGRLESTACATQRRRREWSRLDGQIGIECTTSW